MTLTKGKRAVDVIKTRRKIAIFTGSRAEYGLLRGIMKRIKDDRSLTLQVIATGTHLSKDFGFTIRDILKDGFKIDSRIKILSDKDSGFGMALSLGSAVSRIAKSLTKLQPDIIVLLGDRHEVLAAALAATYMNIPIAHIHGGDVSGSVDQPVRYAISKLSHIHFTATSQSATRLRIIGEDDKRIFVVGAPGLDEIAEKSYTPISELWKKYDIDIKKPLLILLQHPVVTEEKEAAWQIKQTLRAIAELRIQTIIIYPNADAGGRAMIRIIKQYCNKHSFLKSFPSVPREDFLGLMSAANVMVGNSSSAIIESASFRLPVVNIGSRQLGRERAANVIDVNTYDWREIMHSIRKGLEDQNFIKKVSRAKNPYGDGRSSETIARILHRIDLKEFWPKR